MHPATECSDVGIMKELECSVGQCVATRALAPCYPLLEEIVILGVIYGSLVWRVCNPAAPAGPVQGSGQGWPASMARVESHYMERVKPLDGTEKRRGGQARQRQKGVYRSVRSRHGQRHHCAETTPATSPSETSPNRSINQAGRVLRVSPAAAHTHTHTHARAHTHTFEHAWLLA